MFIISNIWFLQLQRMQSTTVQERNGFGMHNYGNHKAYLAVFCSVCGELLLRQTFLPSAPHILPWKEKKIREKVKISQICIIHKWRDIGQARGFCALRTLTSLHYIIQSELDLNRWTSGSSLVISSYCGVTHHTLSVCVSCHVRWFHI